MEVAMVLKVSKIIVPSQRDDSAVHELRSATSDGPQQPVLCKYSPHNFGNEAFTRDFQRFPAKVVQALSLVKLLGR